jgi:hypothetical protein
MLEGTCVTVGVSAEQAATTPVREEASAKEASVERKLCLRLRLDIVVESPRKRLYNRLKPWPAQPNSLQVNSRSLSVNKLTQTAAKNTTGKLLDREMRKPGELEKATCHHQATPSAQ